MVTTRLVGFYGSGPLFEHMSIDAIEQSELEKGQLTFDDFNERTRRLMK